MHRASHHWDCERGDERSAPHERRPKAECSCSRPQGARAAQPRRAAARVASPAPISAAATRDLAAPPSDAASRPPNRSQAAAFDRVMSRASSFLSRARCRGERRRRLDGAARGEVRHAMPRRSIRYARVVHALGMLQGPWPRRSGARRAALTLGARGGDVASTAARECASPTRYGAKMAKNDGIIGRIIFWGRTMPSSAMCEVAAHVRATLYRTWTTARPVAGCSMSCRWDFNELRQG